jgi:NitT/TauT family transport system substrate-binding protein
LKRNILLCAALISLCFCKGEKAAKLEPVRIATRPLLMSGAIYIADEEGFFKDEGIDLIFADAPARSIQAVPLLENEQLDVLSANVNAGMFAAAKTGARLRMVADRGHVSTSGCDFDAVVGRGDLFPDDSPSAAQLRGKRLSINAAVTPEFIVDKFLAAHGVRESELETVSLVDALEAEGLRSKNIDITHASEPYLTQMKDDKQRVIGPASAYAPGAHFGVLVFGPTLTVKNRALGERFMAAYIRGIRQYTLGATPRNVEILSRRMKFAPELLRKACFASLDKDAKLNTKWLDEFQQWAVGRKYLDAIVPLADVVDSTFASKASARLDSPGKF